MYEAKAYHCEFCKKYGLSKSWIVKHEATCYRNPITRSCSTCANRTSYKETVPEFGEGYFKEVPYCLEAILFRYPFVSGGDKDKIKFHTDCEKWTERPEEEEELVIYQRQKTAENIVQIIKDSSETPF